MRLSLKIEYLIILAITITPIAAESQSSIVSNYVRTVSPRVGSTAEPAPEPTRRITLIAYQPDMNLPRSIDFDNGTRML